MALERPAELMQALQSLPASETIIGAVDSFSRSRRWAYSLSLQGSLAALMPVATTNAGVVWATSAMARLSAASSRPCCNGWPMTPNAKARTGADADDDGAAAVAGAACANCAAIAASAIKAAGSVQRRRRSVMLAPTPSGASAGTGGPALRAASAHPGPDRPARPAVRALPGWRLVLAFRLPRHWHRPTARQTDPAAA